MDWEIQWDYRNFYEFSFSYMSCILFKPINKHENLLRQDLLLKLNYANIMEVPRLCKIIIVPKAPSNLIKNVKLVMEIICNQKFTQTQSRN